MKIKVREAINRALKEILSTEKRSYIIGEEVSRGGANGVTEGLQQAFPNRIFDTPISEAGFTGLAIGSSYILYPIVDFMTFNFSWQAVDQILNSAARTEYMSNGGLKYNIVFRGPNGFNRGVGSQHTDCLGRIYGSIPGLTVVIPYTAEDHYGLLLKSVEIGGPVIFLESELLYEKSFEFDETKKFRKEFKSEILKEGTDLCFIGVGHSLEIIEKVVKKHKRNFLVLNLISIRPLDIEGILEAVHKCSGRVIIVEYSTPLYSISSEIGFQILKNIKKSQVEIVTCEDMSTPYGKKMEEEFLPNEDKIEKAIKKFIFL